MKRVDSVFDPAIVAAAAAARAAVPPPFQSPADWRDRLIYLAFLDRFNNPSGPPKSVVAGVAWNQVWPRRQGGTFNGVRAAVPYLRDLGVGAIWLTPVLKNPKPERDYNYTGYAAQDLLAVDARFASDGQLATAEIELRGLVSAAHDAGMHVILDIVLNHTAEVFDYFREGHAVGVFTDEVLLRSPPLAGGEPPVQWINGLGDPRAEWQGDLPSPATLGADDAVHPASDFRSDFFRRRGAKTNDVPDYGAGFAPGDFDSLRQMVVEYFTPPTDPRYRRDLGTHPVLTILARAYCNLIARYDFDGFRIDTVKYVDPNMVETFGNAVREFALSIGKRNFFTFGEVYDGEATIDRFVGRHGSDGFGIDAALDFPLFFQLSGVARGSTPVEQLRAVFDARAATWAAALSSHGDAGRYFVTFLDNHDQRQRIRDIGTPEEQVQLALGLQFTLLGIPCVYYGTEQGLVGTVDGQGHRVYAQYEGVREALWGRPGGLDPAHPTYQAIRRLASLRAGEPAIRYGRQYFRPVAGNGADFGLPDGPGGIVAYSRVLGDREIVVVANTGAAPWTGSVLIDRELSASNAPFEVAFNNLPNPPAPGNARYLTASFWQGGSQKGAGPAACLDLTLRSSELQILRAR